MSLQAIRHATPATTIESPITIDVAYHTIKPENHASGILRRRASAAMVAGEISARYESIAAMTPTKMPSALALVFISPNR